MARSAKTLTDLLRAGVPIIAGVDAPLVPNGLALHTEIAGYVEAGLTPYEALRTATINTATLLNVQKDLGTIEPGKLADVLIVENRSRTSTTPRACAVIRDGEVIAVMISSRAEEVMTMLARFRSVAGIICSASGWGGAAVLVEGGSVQRLKGAR